MVQRINWLAANLCAILLEALTGDLSGLYKLHVGDYRFTLDDISFHFRLQPAVYQSPISDQVIPTGSRQGEEKFFFSHLLDFLKDTETFGQAWCLSNHFHLLINALRLKLVVSILV
ncbi:MAG: type II toxin-antitoxin system RelE family toxin [Thermodesulfobacteriota bacterium]